MQDTLKKFSPAIFGIAIVCFLLPWVNFSCQGQHVATFTGLELVTGTTIQQQGTFGQSQNKKANPEPLAIAVLLLTVLGLALSFQKGGKASLIPTIVGALTLILLFLLKSKIETDAANQSQGAIHTEYAIGFWLALIASVLAIVLNGYLYLASTKQFQA
jgi:phosphatidylserine synthase